MTKDNIQLILLLTLAVYWTIDFNINIQKIEINIHSAIAKTIKPDKSVL